jgi:segregation and condensation protein B
LAEEKKIIEAALFMSPKAVSLEELAKSLGKSLVDAHRLVNGFVQEFNSRDSALEIVDLDNSFQMRVKPEFHGIAKQFASEAELHKSVQKTLALIALKQPIRQSLVIKLRNNKGYDHIKLLQEKGFVTKQPYGRTFILKTTKKFLEHFGSSLSAEAAQRIEMPESMKEAAKQTIIPAQQQ